ncbi:MAG: DegT/DnrJ/EryC1/StrS family aminotransferase, partial [Roseovarius sp.]|nr:DegT/DnrJ/EryC1/StrS family aminotransferase [Roseovarius sp.]
HGEALMHVPLLDLKAQYAPLREEIRAAVDRVMDDQYFILGPEVEALEKEIAVYSECRHAIGVSSGTDALLMALMALDLQPGDEVISTPYTFFATAGAVARLKGKPVFVDIDPASFNIDPAAIEAAITPRTRAIIPVYLYGQVAEMQPIMEVAQRHNLPVIEDAAQAIGAEYNGKRAGSIGAMGCFSFFPSKNLGAFGDAGMIVTNDAALADKLRLLRNHGYKPKYYNRIVGGNFRLDAIQAAVLRVKLKYLDGWTAARQRNAATYRRLFAQTGCVLPLQPNVDAVGLVLPEELPNRRHIYNQFVIRSPRRDAIKEACAARQIPTMIYYPRALTQQTAYREYPVAPGGAPVAEELAATVLSLPMHPYLEEAQIAAVAAAVREAA